MTNLKQLKEDLLRNKQIKEELDSGKTMKEIAEKHGVSIGLPNYLKTQFDLVQGNLQGRIDYYERVLDNFIKGYTLTEIADLEGTTKQNISRILRLGDVDRHEGGKSKKKKDNLKLIKKLHDKGNTLEEIAKITKLDEMKVRQYAYDAEIELITETDIRVKNTIEKVLNYRDIGKTQKDIASELELSQAYVSKILLNEKRRVRMNPDEYEERDKNILNDFESGLGYKELAEKYEISELNVRRIITKFKGQ